MEAVTTRFKKYVCICIWGLKKPQANIGIPCPGADIRNRDLPNKNAVYIRCVRVSEPCPGCFG